MKISRLEKKYIHPNVLFYVISSLYDYCQNNELFSLTSTNKEYVHLEVFNKYKLNAQ